MPITFLKSLDCNNKNQPHTDREGSLKSFENSRERVGQRGNQKTPSIPASKKENRVRINIKKRSEEKRLREKGDGFSFFEFFFFLETFETPKLVKRSCRPRLKHTRRKKLAKRWKQPSFEVLVVAFRSRSRPCLSF